MRELSLAPASLPSLIVTASNPSDLIKVLLSQLGHPAGRWAIKEEKSNGQKHVQKYRTATIQEEEASHAQATACRGKKNAPESNRPQQHERLRDQGYAEPKSGEHGRWRV